MEIALDMDIDTNTVTLNMLRFASLLRLIGQPEIAKNYEDLAVNLRADSSVPAVSKAREWVSMTFRGTSGSLADQYVYKKDGSVDDVLNAEYEELLQKLTDFANGS